jgi:hypothetical protein
MKPRAGWILLLVANALCWCVLGFYQNAAAQRTGGQLPFANPVEQRMEMIQHLKDIRDLLKEQNALLQSGNVQVTVSEPGTR